MSNQLTPITLMAKADRACSSARALLDLGDVDGACNRAYCAMFDAARAALLASGAPVRPGIGKTHSGLINASRLASYTVSRSRRKMPIVGHNAEVIQAMQEPIDRAGDKPC